MPLPANSNNNKESFRLLDLSSDLESDDLQLEIAPSKKKKLQRRSRGVSRVAISDGNTTVSGGARWGESVRYVGYAAALAWIVVLTYAAAALHERLSGLDVRLQTSVSTSSSGMQDALQLCHSTAKELRANATSLDDRLSKLSAEHHNLTENYTRTAAELKALQDKLAAAPELADTPRRLGELSQTVAEFGSRLSGFEESIKSAREAADAAATGLEALRQQFNVTEFASASERLASAERMKQLSDSVAGLNATVETRLAETERRLSEYRAQIKSEAATLAELLARTAAPPTTPSTTTQKQTTVPPVTSSAAPVPVATTSTTEVAVPTAPTSTPGATKPAILQSRA